MFARLQRKILFPRHLVEADDTPLSTFSPLERIWLSIPNGQVEAWFIPGQGVSAESPGPAVIFCHGNAELIEHWPWALAGYREMGVSVLLPEYRGYGRSDGHPSEENVSGDLARFYDQLSQRPEVDADRIVFHGRSMGGGMVCALARRREPAGLILQSTFTSVVDMARRFKFPGRWIHDRLDSLDVVSRLDRPILIVHGRRDELIPVQQAERLHAAAKQSQIVLDDGDHNTTPVDLRGYWRTLETFINQKIG